MVEMDLKSIGLCPQGFESPRCRHCALTSALSLCISITLFDLRVLSDFFLVRGTAWPLSPVPQPYSFCCHCGHAYDSGSGGRSTARQQLAGIVCGANRPPAQNKYGALARKPTRESSRSCDTDRIA